MSQSAAAQHARDPVAMERRLRVLIVDDSRAMRAILRRMTAAVGYEALEAGHGREALQILRSVEVDLVLVDWNMPEMNGIEFVREVRSWPEPMAIPIVMVTTESSPNAIAAARAAGVNGYVTKPFTRHELKRAIEALGQAEPHLR